VYLPAFEYAWVGCFTVEVVPSPKSQVQDVGLPVEVSMNWTVRMTFPLVGFPLKDALGVGVEAALMVKVFAREVPPPGVGLLTVTYAVPAVAISEAGIAAVAWVEETTVVVRSAPFHRTFEVETKPVPVTVRVKAGPPAVAEAGKTVLMTTTGLLTVKVFPDEVPPPGVGLKTVTVGVPAMAISVAGIAAVAWVEERTVVVLSPLFHRTLVTPETKPVPVTVRVKADPPAVAVEGEMAERVGTGLFAAVTLNDFAPEVPPPGVGLKTVTLAVVTVAISVAGIAAVIWVAET
jgi:hypothetical protein